MQTVKLGLLRSSMLLLPFFGCTGETEPKAGGEVKGPVECFETFCSVSGVLDEDLTLTNDTLWLLKGGVFVGNGTDAVTLTIEPGTEVFGQSQTTPPSMLVVSQGSQLMAEGTASAPIVFSSGAEIGDEQAGDWGGIIINGKAPINGCDATPCVVEGEGETGSYGGDDAADNSGVLKYVVVRHGGRQLTEGNELNGIAFQGVGSGTTVDYVHVDSSQDDCMEFYGGTVNASHLICTGIGDDNLDWTQGWTGSLQFMVMQQYPNIGDQGIEADNNSDGNNFLPRSTPNISNVTIVGSPESEQSDIGILVREGTSSSISNAIVMGFNDACVDVDHEATYEQLDNGSLLIDHSIFDCETLVKANGDNDPVAGTDIGPWLMDQTGNVEADPLLKNPYVIDGSRSFVPTAGSPALSGASVPLDVPFFEQVDFIGAIGADDWTAGWAAFE